MLKKFLAISLMAMTGLAATACGPRTESQALSVWVMGEAGQQLQTLLEQFQKENPGITVDVQGIPWGQAHEKLMTAAAGGTLPDVFQVGTTWMSQFSALDVFEPLNDRIQNSQVVSEDKFFHGSWVTNVFNGQVQGLPWYADTRILFYRQDLVEAAGYRKIPEDWYAFQELGNKLIQKDASGQTTRYGMDVRAAGIFFFLASLWQNGASVLNEQMQPALNTAEAIQAIEYYQAFFTEGIAPLIGQQGTELIKNFEAGQVCMFAGGPWTVEEIHRYAPDVASKLGTSMLPGKKQRTSFIGGSNMVIYKGSKHKDQAWKFLEYLSRPEVQMRWYQIAKALPANLETWEDEQLQQDPVLRTFGEQMRDAQSPPNIPQWEEISGEILLQLEKLIYQKITVRDFADSVDRKIVQILAR